MAYMKNYNLYLVKENLILTHIVQHIFKWYNPFWKNNYR